MLRWKPGSSLAGRLRATLLVLAAVLVAVVGVALVLLDDVRDHQERVLGDFYQARNISQSLFVSVLDVESAARDYLTTGSPDALASLRAAQQPRPDQPSADDVVALLGDEAEPLAALEQAREAARTWFGDVQPAVEQVSRAGPAAVSPETLADLDREFDSVRAAYQGYLDELFDAREQARDQLELRTSLLFATVLLAAVAAAAVGAGMYLALERWVTRPLAALAAETRQVRTGDVQHAVRVQGPPDITELADDVEAMRRELVRKLDEVEASRTEMEAARALLEEQAEDLRRSNRDLEQFAYVASHDLQEPLRKVSSFCQMLERRYKGQLDERADQYIEFAVDGAKRMQRLINDLLAFSRVGRTSAGMAPVDLDEVFDAARANLALAIEECDATVTADPLPTVVGDRGLLVQLIQNLVGNAVKFRGEQPPRVHVGVRQDGDSWTFSVTDNGIGIEPQYAERIFVIFQRLHPKSDYEGTGIGLALCKKIVEYHGGEIWLDPSAGAGSTFRWTLPVAPPSPAPVIDEPVRTTQGVTWTSH